MKRCHHFLRNFLLNGLLSLLVVIPLHAEELTLVEIESGKVMLPWTELKKLLEEIETLKRAKIQEKVEPKEPIPVDYSITEAHFTGEVKGNSARFEAKFSVQVLKEGWIMIPFFPSDIGIESVHASDPTKPMVEVINMPENETPLLTKSADELPLAQLVREEKGYHLVVKGPQSLSVQITFYAPILVEASNYTLAFLPPRSVVNHLLLHIPEKGAKLLYAPPHSQIKLKEDSTMIETVLSERDTLKFSWKIEKDDGLTRKSLATYHALASIDKSDIAVSSSILLKYIHSFEQIALELPLQAEILNVTSQEIEQWSTEKLEQSQVIKLTGPVDPRSIVKLEISYRLKLPQLPAEVTVPMITVMGVDNVEGLLGIEALENIEITPKEVKDGSSIAAKNLPKTLWQKTSNPLLYGYQFFLNHFTARFNVKSYQEIQTVVANVDLVDCVTHRTLEGTSVTRALYFIRNNDRQFLTLKLPKKSKVWQAFLDGQPVKPAQKESGEILVPMKKSVSQGDELQSFLIEIGYTTEVDKLTLKGDFLNQLPVIDIPVSYLRWNLYLPEYYEYSRFEGPLKQVTQFSQPTRQVKAQVDIPAHGQLFLFEKRLIVDEEPYVRGKYGQFLGDDIFLSFHHEESKDHYKATTTEESKQQVILNRMKR